MYIFRHNTHFICDYVLWMADHICVICIFSNRLPILYVIMYYGRLTTSIFVYVYIYSIVFLDIGMPLLKSMLLSLLLTPVKIGPSNTSPG